MMTARLAMGVAAIALLSGCHWFKNVVPDCHQPQDYQHARQVAPLRVPAGLDSPNVQSALVIPDIGVAPPPPGPKDACLDSPPRYKAAPATKAGGG